MKQPARYLLVAAVVWAFSSVLPVSASEFAPAVNYNAGTYPIFVAASDLNGDGKLDLVVANANSNDISVFLGKGDGTFRPRGRYSVTAGPKSVVLADFNGDGNLDIAVACGYLTISLLLGNGDGTFRPAINIAGVNAYSLAAADFNADGKIDLAEVDVNCPISPCGDGLLDIFLGNGNGSFQPPVPYTVGTAPISVAIGDFNRDGRTDLAIADHGNCCDPSTVSVLLGNGDGTLQARTDYLVGMEPNSIAVGDFNSDSVPDLVVADTDNNVAVLLGNGDGTFQPTVTYLAGLYPSSVAVADFNNDGSEDVAVANGGTDGNTVSVLLNEGLGVFQGPTAYPTGAFAQSVASGDFNRDGQLDLAAANADGTVSVLLNTGASPAVTLSATSLNFGNQKVGTTSQPQKITLTNTGSFALQIASMTVSGDFLEKNSCGPTLQLGHSCTITVVFRPRTRGARTGTVLINDDAPDSPQTIQLSGAGIR